MKQRQLNKTLILGFCFSLLAAFTVGACGDETKKANSASDSAPKTDSAKTGTTTNDSHGDPVSLGQVTLLGDLLQIERQGSCAEGQHGAVIINRLAGKALANLYLWVEDANGKQVSTASQAEPNANNWHFHVTVKPGSNPATTLVIRHRANGLDKRVKTNLYANFNPKESGTGAALMDQDGKLQAFVELKLHDDKGDLELWLRQADNPDASWDLAIDSEITLQFPNLREGSITLKARNHDQNEDEAGRSNNRNGQTNYFIFPGDTKADSTWLQGTQFNANVVITIQQGDKTLRAGPFNLRPHAHGPGGHKH